MRVFRLENALILIGLSVLLLVFPSPATGTSPRHGGTLSLGHEIDAAGFDAIKGRSLMSASRVTALLVMERLFDMDANDRLVPVLGLDAATSEDGKTWTVNLRRGGSLS